MATKKSSGKIIQFPLSPEKYIRTKGRMLPVRECIINDNWKKSGMASILLARTQPSGNITLAFYLMDLLCVGLKDTFNLFNLSPGEYEKVKKEINPVNPVSCSYELAHNIIYGAIAFAEDLGLKPQKDWAVTQYLLAEDTEDVELIDVQFGNAEGRPLLIITPAYPLGHVIAHLDKTLGRDNYDIISDVDSGEDFMDEDDEDEDDDDSDEEDKVPEEIVFGESVAKLYELYNFEIGKKGSGQIKPIRLRDYHFIDVLPKVSGYKISPREKEMMEDIFPQVAHHPEQVISRLEGLVKEYPGNMIFQNYLGIAYSYTGKVNEGKTLMTETYKQFPYYLFARCNYAHQLLNDGLIEEFPAVFNQGTYDLKALYPGRDSFHITEFISFYLLMARFYAMTGDLQNTDYLMGLLDKITLEWNREQFIINRKIITDLKVKAMFGDSEKSALKGFKSYVPKFRNKIIRDLAEQFIDFSPDVIKKILLIPHAELYTDLRQGYIFKLRNYYIHLAQNSGPKYDDFLRNAFFLLGENAMPEVLKDLLFILSQDFDVLDNFFGQMLTEKAWMPICRLGRGQLPVLIEFCQNIRNETSMIIVTQAMVQMALNFPDSHEEVKNSLKDLAMFYMNEADESQTETDFVSNLVCDMADLGDEDLLPTIKALYDADLVDFGYAGTYAEIREDILAKRTLALKLQIENIFEIYDDIEKNWK